MEVVEKLNINVEASCAREDLIRAIEAMLDSGAETIILKDDLNSSGTWSVYCGVADYVEH